jgi:hypothetical protein
LTAFDSRGKSKQSIVIRISDHCCPWAAIEPHGVAACDQLVGSAQSNQLDLLHDRAASSNCAEPGLKPNHQGLPTNQQGPELAHFKVVLQNDIRPLKAGDQLGGSGTTKNAVRALPIAGGLGARLGDETDTMA